ncbi:ATP-binding protein [Aliiglaciecola litoralis]|uniref:histidine kinase n=1 Tax=Aliiglaciecola litoralis TaxID=582857 RepID=A0ABN1LR20_9ALTE
MKYSRLLGNNVFSWVTIVVIVLAVICANAYLAVKTTKELTSLQQNITNTDTVVMTLDDLHLDILAAQNSQRGFLLTREDDYLRTYRASMETLSSQLSKFKDLGTQIVGSDELIDRLLGVINKKTSDLELSVTQALAANADAPVSIREFWLGHGYSEQIEALFDQLVNKELQYRDVLISQLSKAKNESVVTFIVSAATSTFLLLGLLFLARANLASEEQFRNELELQNQNLAEKVKERTAALTVYSEELVRSNRELEDFAFVASHDLQEPLRKIRAFGDRLESNYAEQLGEKGQDYLQRMQNAAKRMSNLISDLLEFSRVTTKGKAFVEVDLNTVMSNVIGDLEIAVEESQTTFEIDKLPIISADHSQMNQLFLNLISNSIKFRRVDVPPLIKLTWHSQSLFNELINESEEWHIIQLTDNGIGFESEFADKIFVPFQRLHGRTEYQGTGIGLAVCRRIVERHGGKIEAKSELGKGAIFEIKLPVVKKQETTI